MTASNPSLLIVEDDLALQKQIKWSLDGYASIEAGDRETALRQSRRHRPAVVTMDLGLPPDPDCVSEGFKLLEQLLDFDPLIKVIVITGQNGRSNALRAVELGAYDFLEKPFDPDVLSLIVDRAYKLYMLQAENARLRVVSQSDATQGVITCDEGLLRICRSVEKVAPSSASVMLLGESGTGKEVLAQALHVASKRSGRFVAINCAAIPEALLESELFGFERGAFTGATKTTVGRIETAHGGTLMLDEIGDLPHSLQAKLLRFLQQRTIERIGGRHEIPIDTRIVSATHQDLQALIREGRFREDLYYRLSEIVVQIPPLRKRQGDAVLLAHAFLRRFSEEQRRTLRFTGEALRAIEAHGWPGNVRELINVVRRAAIMADDQIITMDDLGLPVAGGTLIEDAEVLDLRTVRERVERITVVTALARCDGNLAKAAELLGVSRPTLYDLLSRLSIRVAR